MLGFMQHPSTQAITAKFAILSPLLDERARRLWAAAEARALGHGGISQVAEATGLSRATIRAGLQELARPVAAPEPQTPAERVRRPGGGRKPLGVHDPHLLRALEALVDPVTREDPMSLLRWTCKSAAKLAAALQTQGRVVSERTVNRLLHDLGYSLQANRKTLEGRAHPDRDAQFHYINRRATPFQRQGQPVVSVDTKKKELVGQFRQSGREWHPQGQPEEVQVHDLPNEALGKVIPYGVYDEATNTGWVSVGIDHDTATFAVETVRRWWRYMGSKVYPRAKRLLITADGGGSNGSRCRLWKVELQQLADEIGLHISVCHFPPGTSKWNKIEHRMFCYITEHWRGRPLVSREVVVNLIGHTTTKTGLAIRSELDVNLYPTGREVTAQQMESLAIKQDKFHGEWNYTLQPRA
jgi:transposase